MTATYGSLFAGVGGFDMGFDRAGYDCRFQVEWDSNCQNILNRHWPDVPKWWDVGDVNGAELPPVDVLIFGSPCQDLSIAGKRVGLDGARSGLFYEAMRIVKEMRDATGNTFPRVVVWENVVGALNSNGGADFGEVLDQMAEAGALVIEWAVLDAQHFGVPQRRRRVFVVAILDPASAAVCPDPLLPVAESVQRHSEKGRKKKEETPAEVGVDIAVSHTFRMLGHGHYVQDDTASAMKARDYKDATDLIAPPPTSRPSIRRLTPVECERLMGWPDDHTRWTADGKEQADTHRYRQCGNGVATPVAQWIAGHLLPILATTTTTTTTTTTDA